MRHVKLLALLAALTVLMAACGNDSEDVPEDEGEPEITTPVEEDVQDDRGAELDDDVAAVVNDEEIPASIVEEQVEIFSTNPELAEALAGEDAEVTRAVMHGQILTTLIVRTVALQAADDLGVPVTDEDVEEARAEVEAEAGGAEGLQEELAQGGMSERQLDVELRGIAALRNIQEALAEEEDAADDAGAEDGAEDPEAPDDAADPAELRAQQHVRERLLAADVVVNDDYGTWDPQSGQVTPKDVPQAAPESEPAPEPAPES